MQNLIDFYHSQKNQLSIAVTEVVVYIDGSLYEGVKVKEIVRRGWPEFGWARLAVVNKKDIEDCRDDIRIGQAVCIKRLYSEEGVVESIPVFAGRVERIEKRRAADEETVEIIVRDFSSRLEEVTIYGQWVGKEDGTILFLGGMDTIFNENAMPNATNNLLMHNGRTIKMFAENFLKGRAWSCAEVIEYLLMMYLPAGVLGFAGAERLKAITDNQKVYDLDVTGLNLLQAIERCCEKTGLEFKFEPSLSAAGPVENIVFYRRGAGRCIELNMQRAGDGLNISKTGVSEISGKRGSPVTHRYIGQGDFKRFEATFELKKGWDSSLESIDYERFSPSGNAEFYKVKDVYRKWVLNEAGDYTGQPFNCGEAFDFGRIFENSNFVGRRRRFWPALTRDEQGKSIGYFLEVSYDDGEHWWQYPGAFENRLDECAVWLSSDRLDVNTWIAALKGVLRFRMTASVFSDERISCQVADGPVNSVVPVIEHIVTLPNQFKYRKVSGASIFANGQTGRADEVDDGAALYEFIRKKALGGGAVIEEFEAKTAYLLLDVQVGDIVTSSPESRDLFGVKADNRSMAWIEEVKMDFEKQQTTVKIKKGRKIYL
jgi:hypothetical protein